MGSDRTLWTDEDFRNYSDQALAYELTQLLGAHEILKCGVATSQSPHMVFRAVASGSLRNATVESFAIHARALIWFLYPPLGEKIKDTDVASMHYGIKPRDRPENFQPWYNQANKQVAHTTTDRLDLEMDRKTWPVEEMTAALVHEMAAFTGEADPNKVGAGFRGLMDRVTQEFPG